MKKYLLFIAAIGMTNFAIAGKMHITIKKEKGGPAGYNYVHEKHKTSRFTNAHTLECKEQGLEKGEWTNMPVAPNALGDNAYPKIESYVMDRVSHNVLSGKASEEGVRFSWTSNADHTKISISVKKG